MISNNELELLSQKCAQELNGYLKVLLSAVPQAVQHDDQTKRAEGKHILRYREGKEDKTIESDSTHHQKFSKINALEKYLDLYKIAYEKKDLSEFKKGNLSIPSYLNNVLQVLGVSPIPSLTPIDNTHYSITIKEGLLPCGTCYTAKTLITNKVMNHNEICLDLLRQLAIKYPLAYENLLVLDPNEFLFGLAYNKMEGDRIEFKGPESDNMPMSIKTLKNNFGKYLKTVCAFLNTNGGSLYIGIIDKSRKIVGVEITETQLDELQQYLVLKLKEDISPSYSLKFYSLKFHKIKNRDDTYVIEILVLKCDNGECKNKKHYYIRGSGVTLEVGASDSPSISTTAPQLNLSPKDIITKLLIENNLLQNQLLGNLEFFYTNNLKENQMVQTILASQLYHQGK
ncbi:hypothetical protein CYY_007766 [Polysphondylium violaceum]|uniref:Schlafen AlbA-2 domain-containing protein n=1 Tax=Polysphondylium violaceum TaxID=133409 RepID=A0A8J4V1Y2_9MYCE|nr:hypothetical protein CYY_007766 [Polysphondylium violaceum]